MPQLARRRCTRPACARSSLAGRVAFSRAGVGLTRVGKLTATASAGGPATAAPPGMACVAGRVKTKMTIGTMMDVPIRPRRQTVPDGTLPSRPAACLPIATGKQASPAPVLSRAAQLLGVSGLSICT